MTRHLPRLEARPGETVRLITPDGPPQPWAHQLSGYGTGAAIWLTDPQPRQGAGELCGEAALVAGREWTMADAVGPDLAIAAGDVAEALETARAWPCQLREVSPAIGTDGPGGEFVPGDHVRIIAVTPDGTEVEVTVKLTGHKARGIEAEMAQIQEST